jgi:hypothetical protein
MSNKDNSGPARVRQSPHARALEALGAKLAEAGISERQLLGWLKKVQAEPPGIFALQSIPTRRLEILLEQWEDTILPQLLQ